METIEAATKAREALNGKQIDGRKIEVNNATPRSATGKGNKNWFGNQFNNFYTSVTFFKYWPGFPLRFLRKIFHKMSFFFCYLFHPYGRPK